MRILSHDPFARIEIVRVSVHLGELTGPTCAWCGGAGRHLANDERVLYRYGHTEDDDLSATRRLSKELFCSKSCYDIYHGR